MEIVFDVTVSLNEEVNMEEFAEFVAHMEDIDVESAIEMITDGEVDNSIIIEWLCNERKTVNYESCFFDDDIEYDVVE